MTILEEQELLARRLLAASDAPLAREMLFASAAHCLWDDEEELLTHWNTRFAGPLGLTLVREARAEYGCLTLATGRRRRLIRVEGSRDDGLRLVHGLASLVRTDLELRLCRDSVGHSSNAFLALPPSVWRALSTEFPVRRSRERFMRLPADFERFMDDAFPIPAPNPRQQPGEWGNWVDAPSECPPNLRYEIVDDGAGQLRPQVLRALIQQHLDPGAQWLDVVIQPQQPPRRLQVDREILVDHIRDWIGKVSIRVASESRVAFLLITPNGVATGWRVERDSSGGPQQSTGGVGELR